MRNGLKILTAVIILFCDTAFAEVKEADSLNTIISKMVEEQVAKTQYNNKIDEQSKADGTRVAGSFWNSNDFIFLSLLISFGFNIYFYFIYLRRTPQISNGQVDAPDNHFKKNIALLREEKIGAPDNNRHSEIRNKLRYQLWQRKLGENDFASNAKKMSISQGELALASKLNIIGQRSAKKV